MIGYVGRTGLATGPHLHYELMFDGVQINPRTADLPDTENLTAFQVAQLKTIARPIQARFDLLAESESLPVPTVLRTHRDDATAVAKHLLGDEEQAEGASRVAHRVTSMKEDRFLLHAGIRKPAPWRRLFLVRHFRREPP